MEVVNRRRIASAQDLVDLLPADRPDPFTTADIAAGYGRPRRLAQQAAYCLRKADGIAATGKTGNAVEYSVIHPSP